MQITYSNKQNDVVRMIVGRYTDALTTIHPQQKDGESAQAFNKRLQYGNGMRDAYAEAFAVIIASVRISRYGARLESIPAPPGFEVAVDLLPAIEAGWEVAYDKREKTRDVASFYEALESHLEEYIFPSALEEQFELARRKAVLDGKEPAENGDGDWLKEKAAQLEQRAADIRSMLQ